MARTAKSGGQGAGKKSSKTESSKDSGSPIEKKVAAVSQKPQAAPVSDPEGTGPDPDAVPEALAAPAQSSDPGQTSPAGPSSRDAAPAAGSAANQSDHRPERKTGHEPVQIDQVASTRSRPADQEASDPEARAESLAPGSSPVTAHRLAENIERLETLGQRLMTALSSRSLPNPGIEGPGPELMMTAATAWIRTMSEQPGRVLEGQVKYWGETLRNYADAQMALARGRPAPPEDDAQGDARFANPLWNNHPFFSFVKRQYLINAKAMRDASRTMEMPDDVAQRRIAWMTDQIIDMMAPTNFLATNPDALERAIATDGESLVKGLENLVRDVEVNGGDLLVSLADRDAFTVGENVGASLGTVVHRTPLYELIQYSPVTDQVHEVPLLIFPPWINKFYILDLKPKNSLIKWLTEQGHTLFVASWKNPDASYADTGLEDYVSAYLDAMDSTLR